MGRIATYVTDTEINDGDRLLGSEAASNVTKNYSVLASVNISVIRGL